MLQQSQFPLVILLFILPFVLVCLSLIFLLIVLCCIRCFVCCELLKKEKKIIKKNQGYLVPLYQTPKGVTKAVIFDEIGCECVDHFEQLLLLFDSKRTGREKKLNAFN